MVGNMKGDNIECYLQNNVTFKKGVDCSEWYKD